ncbi:MAG: helix-turn-helix domain-containing protein [Burkholderiaceae bacterium]|jgi:DNA-binding transcriptional regulator YdaS (Cro superfamily)|nr:helix-turn-helix domain-containing protein [Burkholderiaceae bacterium]
MTKLQTWISGERGRAAALAAHLNVSRSRVSQMCEEGVPTRHMLAVRDFTNNDVTLEDMVISRTPRAIDLSAAKEVAHG